jgi:4-amino-4-deoxy-L-arabinose transferase-like glycosyltransferase
MRIKLSNNFGKYIILLPFVGLYIFNISKYFWTLSVPSDPLQYLGSAVSGTTWGYWPWLDRITLAVNLRFFTMLFLPKYIVGMIYAGFINTAILIISMVWALKKSGSWAALLVGIFINSSYLMLGWSTYLYPDQTVALYTLLAFIFYFSNIKDRHYFKPVLMAGFFAALASFTKVTGIVAPLFFIIYIICKKRWKHLKEFLLGIITGSIFIILFFILLYNWQSFINVYQQFFFGKAGISNNIITDLNIVSYGASYFHEILLSMKYFPFVALFFAIGAYRNEKTKNLFFLAWLNIIMLCLLRPTAPSIPSYIYTAYVFTCLGLAIYLSDLISNNNEHK